MACTSRRDLLRSNPTCNMRTGPPSVTPAGSHRKRDPGGGPRLHAIQSRMPLRGTSKDENRGRPPVEPGNVTGAVSPSFSLAPGPLGTNNCRCEHECQSLRCAKVPRATTPDSNRREGLEMDVLVDRCAGLDVH